MQHNGNSVTRCSAQSRSRVNQKRRHDAGHRNGQSHDAANGTADADTPSTRITRIALHSPPQPVLDKAITVAENDEYKAIIHASLNEHGPAHIHVQDKRNDKQLRFALVRGPKGGIYLEPMPYYESSDHTLIRDNQSGKRLDKSPPRPRKESKHFTQRYKVQGAQNSLAPYAQDCARRWREIFGNPTSDIYDPAKAEDFITHREIEGMHYGSYRMAKGTRPSYQPRENGNTLAK